LGVEFVASATLPLLHAAEEAWMSINPLHPTAARERILLNPKSLVWAANGDWER